MRVTLLRRADLWLPPLVLMGVIFFLSAQPDLGTGLGKIDLVIRKCLHFGAYAALTFLWWRVFRIRTSPSRAAVLALLASSAYAASDEWHQSFVEGRHASPVDWAIDTAGAAAAALRLTRATRARA
jgi:VanZ family protein